MCTALVVGNIIGSGVFLLPASLAPFGWNAVVGWVATIAGALTVAAVFARLARAMPAAGGPYAYTREAFGRGVGFAVAWTYWLSVVIGNAAIAAGSISYLSVLFPVIATAPGLAALSTVASVWAMTLLNCRGVRSAGAFQTATTLLKVLPLAAVVLVAAFVLTRHGTAVLHPFRTSDLHLGAVTSAATLTLWALLGLESATVPADKVRDPGRTIPRATMAGTAFAGSVYLFACSAVLLMTPAAALHASAAPFAVFLDRWAGGHAGVVLAAFACLSGFGALNGWVLLQGELPRTMAEQGVFPRWLAVVSANGTPVRAHVASSALLTVAVLLNYQRSLIDLFTFIALVATTSSLFAYVLTAAAALWLQRRARLAPSWTLSALAVLAGIYSLGAIWGAGLAPAAWGAMLLALSAPVYWIMVGRTPAK